MLTDISSEAVASVLPLYITGALGLSVVAYGFLDGIHQGVSAVVRIAAGWASDRTNQPKWVATAGYALSAVARSGLLVASGFAAVTAVIAVDRLGKGIRTAPRDALITAAAQPEHLGRSFGVHRMMDTVGATLGPLVAFLVLVFIPNGFHTVFAVSLAFSLVGLAVIGLFVPNLRTRQDNGVSHPQKRVGWRELNCPRLRRLLLTAGLLGLMTIGDGFIFLVLYSKGAFDISWFPLLYVGTNAAFLLLAIPMGRLADRWGRLRIFLIGHVALLAAYVCAALPVTGIAPAMLCLFLLGTFYAATDGVLAALAGQFSPPGGIARGIAAAQTVIALTRLVASTGFGILWFTLGREEAVWVAVGAMFLAILAASALHWRAKGPDR